MNSEWNASCRTSRAGTAASLPRDTWWEATTTATTTGTAITLQSSFSPLRFDTIFEIDPRTLKKKKKKGKQKIKHVRTRPVDLRDSRAKRYAVVIDEDRTGSDRPRSIICFRLDEASVSSFFFSFACSWPRHYLALKSKNLQTTEIQEKKRDRFLKTQRIAKKIRY